MRYRIQRTLEGEEQWPKIPIRHIPFRAMMKNHKEEITYETDIDVLCDWLDRSRCADEVFRQIGDDSDVPRTPPEEEYRHFTAGEFRWIFGFEQEEDADE